jgi:HTH DNA binding domain
LLRQVTLELDMENEIQAIARDSGVRLTVADCRDLDTESMTMLLELEGKQGSLEGAVSAIRRARGMSQLHETSISVTKRICLVVVDKPPICSASMGVGVVCLQCPYSQGGEKVAWKVLVRRSGDIRALVGRLKDKGISTHITSISEVDQEELLTGRQKEVISTAVRLGFFDFPRKVSVTELGAKLGIKPSTLSEILRSAERKIMEKVARDLSAA